MPFLAIFLLPKLLIQRFSIILTRPLFLDQEFCGQPVKYIVVFFALCPKHTPEVKTNIHITGTQHTENTPNTLPQAADASAGGQLWKRRRGNLQATNAEVAPSYLQASSCQQPKGVYFNFICMKLPMGSSSYIIELFMDHDTPKTNVVWRS